MKKFSFSIAFVLTFFVILSSTSQAQNVFYVEASTTYVLPTNFNPIPVGGDTIKIVSGRTETLKFKGFEGNMNSPIIFINDGGQVHINTAAWGALSFENCKYIKLSGKGDPAVHYGFKLQGGTSGLSFLEYSSDCEVEFVEIEGLSTTFFGIYAKKDFGGNPPIPYPIFKNLSIHDTYIHDLGEGIYIGETTSPGMEFRHLRIYNNVVVNTLRESAQIANSVDDVGIYNNFFLNSGLENILYQQNSLQIGNNTIAKVYNNVIINTPANGIIILGNGDISVTNNFIHQTNGIFIDDRYLSIPYSPISIEQNFFSEISNSPVIENMNQFNELFIRNNEYNSDLTFFENSVESLELVVIENNQRSTIADFQYTLENGIFENSTENPLVYQLMGPQIGLGHVYNDSPILQTVENILIDYATNTIINLTATVGDQDILHFESRDLPPFAQINEISSGQAELILNPLIEHVGVYEIGIMVYDESHHAYDRQIVTLSVRNPNNHTPELNFDSELILEAASKFQLDITAIDADNDSIYYTANSLPVFAKIISNNGQVFLELQPKISDTGIYIIDIFADDGFGSIASKTLSLSVNQPILTEERIIYRINFGGPELEAEPINWEADLINSEPAYSTTYFLRTGSWSWSGINNTSAPDNLFGPFRYDLAGGTEMQFEFPLSKNGIYEVKLFFAERSTEADANTTGTFNAFLENNKVLDMFSIYQNAQLDACEQIFEVTVDDLLLNLSFQQIENNVKINGIEISYLSDNTTNHSPKLLFEPNLNLEAATKYQLNITASDLDNDSLFYTSNNLPTFAKIISDANQVFLDIQPKVSDTGLYVIDIIADDGFSSPTSRTLNLNISQPTLIEERIIYRVNIGGPEIEAEPINWESDLVNSVAVYSTTYFLRTGSWSWSGVNNTSAPNNLFGPFRYDVASGSEMQFAFPLSTSGRYEVKLFFAERSTEVDANTTGTFNVLLENTEVLNTFNIYQSSAYEANEQSFEINVEDGMLNLDFQQIENNSKLNGIEINYLGEIPENENPEIQTIAPIVLNENEGLEIPITILDDDFETCNSLSISTTDFPSFASIIQNSEGDYFLNLQPNFEDAGIYENASIMVSDGCLNSSTALSISVINTNRLPIFESIDNIELQAGNSLTIDIFASDADGDLIDLNSLNTPDFIQFIDFGNGQGELQINPSLTDVGNYAFEVIALDANSGESALPVIVNISAAPASERILLTIEMISDLVDGASRFIPIYLVNEQRLNPFLNQHPRSKSWVPSKYITSSSFSTLIDLGTEYYIDYAMLHDMRYTDDLHISVGTPDNWTEITSFSTSSFRQWKEVNLNSTSRYLLLTMYNTVYAQINEIALYGYVVGTTDKSKTANESYGFPAFTIYPNPAKDYLRIQNKSANQIIEILSTNGKVLLRTQEDKAEISHLPNGIYLLRLFDQEKMIFQDRFVKY